MLAFSFPPFPLGVLAAFAFVPFFMAFEDIESLGRGFRNSYVMFFFFNLFSLWWVGGFIHGKDPYLMAAGASLILAHPLFMFVPIAVFVIVRKNLGFRAAVIGFPFIWVAFEYAHSITQFAFPWLLLGNTQTYDLPAVQIASVTGVYGISFWLLWISVLGYVLYAKLALREWRPTSWKSIATIFLIVVVYYAPKAYGSRVLATTEILADGKPVRIGIVQPNIDPFDKWQTNAEKQFAVLHQLTATFPPQQVDLILWPETAIPFFVLSPQNAYVLQRIRHQIDSLGVGLFSGIPDYAFYPDPAKAPKGSRVSKETGQLYDYFNSSMLLQPHTDEIQKYAKIILVPFAERVPYAELFAFSTLLQWNLGLGGWAIGRDSTIFHLRLADSSDVRFSNLICYESIYPGYVARFVHRGAQFLTIITNDSWWGNTFGPYQHQQYAILRAVENRRWIARCANGGISCFIDPLGNVVQPTAMYSQAVITGEIKARDGQTFYSEHGDVLAESCVWVTGLLVAAAFGRMFYNRHRREQ